MASILYIFPHPDDESFGPGPGIVRQRREGHAVHLLTLTRGGATSHRERLGYTKPEMARMRFRQMQQVKETLDLTSLDILEYPDGQLAELNPLVLEEDIADWIYDIAPDVVVTFPDHGITGHPDHLVTHQVVKRVVCALADQGTAAPHRLAFFTFPTPTGNLDPPATIQHTPPDQVDCMYPVRVSDLEQGRRALEYYVTYPPEDDHRPLEFFVDGIPFQFFGETHDSPLTSLLDSLPARMDGVSRGEQTA